MLDRSSSIGRDVSVATRLLRALPAIWLLIHPCTSAASNEQRAVLRLRVNEVEHGDLLVLIGAKDVLARLTELNQAGIKSSSGEQLTVGKDSFVSLA